MLLSRSLLFLLLLNVRKESKVSRIEASHNSLKMKKIFYLASSPIFYFVTLNYILKMKFSKIIVNINILEAKTKVQVNPLDAKLISAKLL